MISCMGAVATWMGSSGASNRVLSEVLLLRGPWTCDVHMPQVLDLRIVLGRSDDLSRRKETGCPKAIPKTIPLHNAGGRQACAVVCHVGIVEIGLANPMLNSLGVGPPETRFEPWLPPPFGKSGAPSPISGPWKGTIGPRAQHLTSPQLNPSVSVWLWVRLVCNLPRTAMGPDWRRWSSSGPPQASKWEKWDRFDGPKFGDGAHFPHHWSPSIHLNIFV